jgi:hypothetical protein
MFRRPWQPLLIVLLAMLVAGCVRTIQPVLKDDQVTMDNSLIGKWVSKDGKESVDIQPPGPNNKTYRVLYCDKDGKKADLLGRLGKIGEITVIELHADNPVPDASNAYKAHLLPVYSFLVVHQTTPQLIVSFMDQDWLKKYLVDHPDELKVIPNIDDQVVTSSTEELQAFLLRHYKDPGALGEQGVFVRPANATAPAGK